MSFRVRALLLVVLVASTATAATAWLILRQASQQITESQTVDRAQVDLVTARLHDYGERHGTWEGVANLVRDLRTETGQRIHLVTEAGTVLVDTDTEEHRTARPLGDSSAVIDPRPQLTLTSLVPPADPNFASASVKATVGAIATYRHGARFAACLTRNQVDVSMSTDSLGVPQFSPAPSDRTDAVTVARQCEDLSGRGPYDSDTAVTRVSTCAAIHPSRTPSQTPAPRTGTGLVTPSADDPLACLAQAFTEQIADVAPVPVRVYLGARGDPTFSLATGPLLTAAAGVVLVVILGTVLLSHRVLRPIGTLTAAAQQLGRGDLGSRVQVHGNDELAALGQSFNRMADSLQRGEERQRRLIADVAHELRTPLANLRGYLEALSDGVIAPDPELFASLHEEAVLQQRIVDDLQDLALAEAGKLAYHRVPVDLAELLETCRTAHRARAESAGVALRVHGDRFDAGAHPLLVQADPDRLRQVLGNLITNALRATPPGGTVSLHAERSGSTAVIRVVDTGTGIEPAALPYIFDRFWRADPARGRHTGGGGLGLAIARQIVTDHAGTITAASQVGTGTTFTITLPTVERRS